MAAGVVYRSAAGPEQSLLMSVIWKQTVSSCLICLSGKMTFSSILVVFNVKAKNYKCTGVKAAFNAGNVWISFYPCCIGFPGFQQLTSHSVRFACHEEHYSVSENRMGVSGGLEKVNLMVLKAISYLWT